MDLNESDPYNTHNYEMENYHPHSIQSSPYSPYNDLTLDLMDEEKRFANQTASWYLKTINSPYKQKTKEDCHIVSNFHKGGYVFLVYSNFILLLHIVHKIKHKMQHHSNNPQGKGQRQYNKNTKENQVIIISSLFKIYILLLVHNKKKPMHMTLPSLFK